MLLHPRTLKATILAISSLCSSAQTKGLLACKNMKTWKIMKHNVCKTYQPSLLHRVKRHEHLNQHTPPIQHFFWKALVKSHHSVLLLLVLMQSMTSFKTCTHLLLHPKKFGYPWKIHLRSPPLAPPQPTDRRKRPNPYLSLYSSQWEAKIKTVSTLSSTACIREIVSVRAMLVRNFMKKVTTRKFGVSTTMLSFMNSDTTKSWMNSRGMLKH